MRKAKVKCTKFEKLGDWKSLASGMRSAPVLTFSCLFAVTKIFRKKAAIQLFELREDTTFDLAKRKAYSTTTQKYAGG